MYHEIKIIGLGLVIRTMLDKGDTSRGEYRISERGGGVWVTVKY